MKWSVRRFQNKDGTLTAEGRKRYRTASANIPKRNPDSSVVKAVEAGKISLKVNSGNQTKHIKGSHNFNSGRSYVLGTLKDCEVLISELYGTGEALISTKTGEFKNKERVTAPKAFGVYVDEDTRQESLTRNGMIHYGKAGSHIVPARPERNKRSK